MFFFQLYTIHTLLYAKFLNVDAANVPEVMWCIHEGGNTQAPLLQHDSRTGTDLEFADTRRKMHFIGQHINAICTLMSPRLVDRDGAKP